MMEEQPSSEENTAVLSNKNNHKCDIQWSLRPLHAWAAILGFELGLHRGGSTFIRLIIYSLGFVLLLTNLWVHLESVGYAFWIRLVTKERNQKQDTTTYIKILSGFTADAVFSVGLPLIFFVSSLLSCRWKQIQYQIFYIQREMDLSEKFHRECRKHCYLIILILPVADIAFHITHEMTNPTASLEKLPYLSFKWALVLSTLSRSSSVTVLSIFCVMVSTSKLLFRELNQRMEALARILADRHGDFNQTSIALAFEKWFRNYDSVCTFVEKINRCFSPILAVTLCHNVILSIRYATLIVATAQSKNPNRCDVMASFIIRILTLLGIFIRLLIVIKESHMIRKETFCVRLGVERALEPISDPLLKTQMTTILLHATYNKPKITAMSFVTIDMSLLLPLESVVLPCAILIVQQQKVVEQTKAYKQVVAMCEPFYKSLSPSPLSSP